MKFTIKVYNISNHTLSTLPHYLGKLKTPNQIYLKCYRYFFRLDGICLWKQHLNVYLSVCMHKIL